MIKALLLGMPDISPRFDVIFSLPNHGLVSLAGNVDQKICEVKVADLLVVRWKWREYLGDLLKSYSPDLIGLSFMSFQYRNAVEIAKFIKNYDNDIKIAIGGYHPTLMYEEISGSPDFQSVDFIIRGEGEGTFSELVTAFSSGAGYEKIAGLSHRAKGIFVHNPPRELLDLDLIQIPNRDARLITKGFGIFGLPSDNIETSRGCTYKCKFCTINKMYGRTFRKYKIERVLADIEDARDHGARYLSISDDNITLDLQRLEDLCDEIISKKLNTMQLFLQATVEGIAHNSGLVRKMADAGVKSVFLGIESEKPKNLDYIDKKSSNPEKTKKAIKNLKDNGIIAIGGFIVGMPDDDEQSLWDTFRTAWELKIDIPVFSILTPQLKSEIRDSLIEQGLVVNTDNYYDYEMTRANIKTKHLTTEELQNINQKMYDKYLVNLNYIWFNQVRKLYPAYFWKTVFGQVPLVIRDLVKKIGS